MNGRVRGKIAVVTGAASRFGIGKAISVALVREGGKVVMTDIETTAGYAFVREMEPHAVFVAHDVRKEEDWRHVFETAKTRFGGIDILVNNAGVTGAEAQEDVESATLENWRNVFATNVEGVVLGCKYGVSAMKANGGAIINISSMAAMLATPTLPAYGASKAAVRQITQTVAQHCARSGYDIRCNSIHPGIIETELVAEAFSPEQLLRLRQSIPSNRFGSPDDVAEAVLYLSSDAARYVTGTRLVVDGGATMQ